MIDALFCRPSPERIFECFVEVAAPTDNEGTFHSERTGIRFCAVNRAEQTPCFQLKFYLVISFTLVYRTKRVKGHNIREN